MAQQLKTLAALSEYPASISITYMGTHSSSRKHNDLFQPSTGIRHIHSTKTYTQENTNTHKIFKKLAR